MQYLTTRRVDKGQFTRVQALAAQPRPVVFGAVQWVAGNRMPDVCHMDANLMGPPGLELAPHMGIALVPRLHMVMGHRRTAAGHNSHFFAVARTAANGRINRSTILPQAANDNGVVNARQRARFELL